MKNDKLQKVRECPINIARMLNVLQIKFKCNVATFKLNMYKSSIKQPLLDYSRALPEISSIANTENTAL